MLCTARDSSVCCNLNRQTQGDFGVNVTAIRNWIFGAVLGGLSLAFASTAWAQVDTEPQVFYVDRANIVGEIGNSYRPYRTIGKALQQVVPGRGDIIYVRPGRYDERIVVPPNTAIIAEAGAGETRIAGNAALSENLVSLTGGTVFSGFTVGPTKGNGLLVANAQSAEVTNCAFHDSGRGVAVDVGATLTITNCAFHANEVSIIVEPGGTIASARNNIFSADNVGIFLNEGATLSSGYNCFFGNGPTVSGGTPDVTDFRANPQFVDAPNQNFHLKSGSAMRDNGDPDAAFNDLDGTANDLGADGGPQGQLDSLAPYIGVEVTPIPGTTPQPLTYQFDASSSFDYWGLLELAWDFDASDGFSFGDALGTQVSHTYAVAGRYLVGVRAVDENGWETEKFFVVDTGNALPSGIFATRRASAAPFRTDLGALTSGEIASVAWDLELDGTVDVERFTTTYILPEDAVPGTYHVGLQVRRANSNSVSEAILPLTLTRATVVAAQQVAPQAGTTFLVESAGVLNGANVEIPRLTVSTETLFAAAAPDADDFASLPEGTLVALAEFGPADRPFAQRLPLSVPLSKTPTDDATVSVYRWDSDTGAWNTMGIQAVAVSPDAIPQAVFEASQLGVFAIMSDKVVDDGNGNGGGVTCNNCEAPTLASSTGDLSIMGLLLITLLTLGIARGRQANKLQR